MILAVSLALFDQGIFKYLYNISSKALLEKTLVSDLDEGGGKHRERQRLKTHIIAIKCNLNYKALFLPFPQQLGSSRRQLMTQHGV